MCILRIHNPISLHTANGSIVTVEVGSVEVEEGGGFTYATGENTTTLWPGWFLCTFVSWTAPLLFPSLHTPSSHLHLHLLSSPSSPTLLPNLPHSLLIPLNPSSILTSTFPISLSSFPLCTTTRWPSSQGYKNKHHSYSTHSHLLYPDNCCHSLWCCLHCVQLRIQKTKVSIVSVLAY